MQDQFKAFSTLTKVVEGGHTNLDELVSLVKSDQFGNVTKNFENFLNQAALFTKNDKDKADQVRALQKLLQVVKYVTQDEEDLRQALLYGSKVFNPTGRKELGMMINK